MTDRNVMEKPLDGAGLLTVNAIINQRLAGKQDASSAITMEQVNAAINAAITGAIEGAY